MKMTVPPISTGAMARYPWDPRAASRFEMKSRFGEDVVLWETSSDKQWLLLPRAACPVGGVDERVVGEPVVVSSSVVPRSEEQGRIILDCVKRLREGKSFVLQASTGFGKTVVACELIAQVGRSTLVIVPKEDLMDSWRAALTRFLDLPDDAIGVVRQDRVEWEGKPVVVGMLQSLALRKYPAELQRYPGFVIWDEVHRLPAPVFQRTAALFPALLRLGLSATPQRADGKEAVVEAHIGPVSVSTEFMSLVPRIYVQRTDWEVPRRWDGSMVPHEKGRVVHILKSMVRDDRRNHLIVSRAMQLFRSGYKLIIFSELRRHLEALHHMLKVRGVPEEGMAYYVGAMRKHEREAGVGRPLLLATYKMAGEGTDIPPLEACILATPRAAVKQSVGRILREHPGKKRPVVVDFVDLDSPVFSGYYKRRVGLYREQGAEVRQLGGV